MLSPIFRFQTPFFDMSEIFNGGRAEHDSRETTRLESAAVRKESEEDDDAGDKDDHCRTRQAKHSHLRFHEREGQHT